MIIIIIIIITTTTIIIITSSNTYRSLYGRVILPCGSLILPPPLLLWMISYNSFNNNGDNNNDNDNNNNNNNNNSNMSALCCPYNGGKARCIHCVCVREKCQCVSCQLKRAGRCKNIFPVSDIGPLFSHAVTCHVPAASVLTSSRFSSPSTSPTTTDSPIRFHSSVKLTAIFLYILGHSSHYHLSH